jgi:hypothetical protein
VTRDETVSVNGLQFSDTTTDKKKRTQLCVLIASFRADEFPETHWRGNPPTDLNMARLRKVRDHHLLEIFDKFCTCKIRYTLKLLYNMKVKSR